MSRDPLKPRAAAPRSPTDTAQKHGEVMNPPRMMQIGGADSLHKTGGPHRNKLTIRKPGGTR